MDALQFLTLMWPKQGWYCLVTPFTPAGSTKPFFTHKVFSTVAEAAVFADRHSHDTNIFYCVHSLKQERVFNPTKKNYKTGEMGAYEYRTQSNMLACRALFFDIDVGESLPNKTPKYSSQSEALAALKKFCEDTKLPKPMIVSSGGGLHVYWNLTDDLPTEEWKLLAAKLKKLAMANTLLIDPSRTTDNASVLRVVGTYNHKTDTARPVKMLTPPCVMDKEYLEKKIDEALIRSGAPATTVTPRPAVTSTIFGVAPAHARVADTNVQKLEFDGPPVSMKALVGACLQVRRVAKLRGNVSEPEWYATLSNVRLVENGGMWVHKISDGHPDYDADATDAKVRQLEDKGIGPTTCERFADLDRATCRACPFWGKAKSPMAAARKNPADEPAPVYTYNLGPLTITLDIPDPPKGYKRTEHGIQVSTVNEGGDPITYIIYENDLHPVKRLTNTTDGTEEQLWRVVLPRSGSRDFLVPADALYDKRKLAVVLSNNGVYPAHDRLGDVSNYMIAYIQKLQKELDAETQCTHLGWTEDNTRFILPDRILQPDGSMLPASLSLGAQRSSVQVHKKGDAAKQIELMKFYDFPAYIPNQFYMLCGLGAPLFFMTGHHGIIVNASGEPGASKSTSLYTAASFWGQPELYPINGTNNGATVKGRNERVTTLANLPVCVDEITHMKAPDAIDLAMSITQPGHRIRLETTGIERASVNSYKATMMLCTANNSLHNILSADNAAGTAGSMRVFEIMFKKGVVHKKHEADDYWHDLKQNYGHLGEMFMSFVVQNKDKVEKRVRDVMRKVDLAANISSGERFWSAAIAVAIVTGEIAKAMKILPYDVAKIEDWAINRQVPYMRGIVQEEYSNPISILADYLETINENILRIQKNQQSAQHANIALIERDVRGQLLARYEMDTGLLYVLKHGFKGYCQRIGASERLVLEELSVPRKNKDGVDIRICVNKNARKVLGAGTSNEKMQAHVFVIDMTHPDVAGTVDLGVVTNPAPVKLTPPRGHLVDVSKKEEVK